MRNSDAIHIITIIKAVLYSKLGVILRVSESLGADSKAVEVGRCSLLSEKGFYKVIICGLL